MLKRKLNRWNLTALLIFSFVLAAFSHPFYVSITAIDYDAKKQNIEISSRVFYDDLELAIKNAQKKRIDLINPKNKVETDSAISIYFKNNLALSVNNKTQKLQYVGYEIVDDVAWCYFEIPNIKQITTIQVQNKLLYQDFKSQSNIMHVTVNGNRKSSKLDNPKRSDTFNF